jgi:hypothetical protein
LSNIFSKVSAPVVPKAEIAAYYQIVYRPEAFRGTEIDLINALEVDMVLSQLKLSYSH